MISCHQMNDVQLKMHHNTFSGRSLPEPAEVFTALLRHFSWI